MIGIKVFMTLLILAVMSVIAGLLLDSEILLRVAVSLLFVVVLIVFVALLLAIWML